MDDASAVRWYLVQGINPEPWTASEATSGRKGGQRFIQFHKPPQLRAYQEALKEEFVAQNPHYVKCDGDIALYFYFWRNIGSGDNFTGRRTRANYADVTNLQKSTEDALQSILYDNDRSVVSVASSLIDQGPDVEPALLVGIGAHDGEVSVAAIVLQSLLHRSDGPEHGPTEGRGDILGTVGDSSGTELQEAGTYDPASAPATDFF